MVTAAIAALAAAASALAWPHYQQLLGRFMRIMGRDASKACAAPRAVFMCFTTPWWLPAVAWRSARCLL